MTYDRVSNLTGKKATSSARSVNPTFAATSVLEMDLPGPMIQYPHAATRKTYQPRVTTPAG